MTSEESWTCQVGPVEFRPPSHVRIRTIELLPTSSLRAVPARLYGTARTCNALFGLDSVEPPVGCLDRRAHWPLVRLIYDLDESETTETLDAPSDGVDYTIPFGLVASVAPAGVQGAGAPRASVTLHSGEVLQLERAGDLGTGNAGMLVFVEGRERPEYVPGPEIVPIDFDRPPAMYPPLKR